MNDHGSSIKHHICHCSICVHSVSIMKHVIADNKDKRIETSGPKSLMWSQFLASNFKIYSFKTGDSLHLKLTGDFDGSSAYELINMLADGKGSYEIFINTNDLKSIYPFGRQIFQKRLGALKKQCNGITFVGKNKQEMGFD